MTALEIYRYAQIEVNKLEAPSMLLEDYLYLLNKAVQQKINISYNLFDINQQMTDDLRVLQTDIILDTNSDTKKDIVKRITFELPEDYLHILNCVATFQNPNPENNKCGYDDESNTIIIGCKKLTMDQFPQVISDYYMKPSYKNPYFLISNRNTTFKLPTNSDMDNQISQGIGNRDKIDNLLRKSNQSKVNLDIVCGIKDIFDLKSIYVSYLKSPQFINLTWEEIENVDPITGEFVDISQIIEFPDYVCYEIINIFTKLLLENASDPRLQTHFPINQTIMTGNQ